MITTATPLLYLECGVSSAVIILGEGQLTPALVSLEVEIRSTGQAVMEWANSESTPTIPGQGTPITTRLVHPWQPRGAAFTGVISPA